MVDSLRVATFNVQNLFSRAKVFNYANHTTGDEKLEQIADLDRLLKKKKYTAADKRRILEFSEKLKRFIVIREDRGKLFKRRGFARVGIAASGSSEWDGTIAFKDARFTDVGRKNTAKVIRATKSDIVSVIEVENRPVLRRFDSHLLYNRYRYEMLIDANDSRGIDVGLLSKYPFGTIKTHMFDRKGNSAIFSRDCLEVEVHLPAGQTLTVLCNHFKSKGYNASGTADGRRRGQADRVVEILRKYDLRKDWIIVAGDLNDTPESSPLESLMNLRNLYDVLALQFPGQPQSRWTYHYQNFEQIDYLLVSKPLKDRFLEAGVIRKGIAHLKQLTSSSSAGVQIEKEYPSVTNRADAASDHGAVWAEFEQP